MKTAIEKEIASAITPLLEDRIALARAEERERLAPQQRLLAAAAAVADAYAALARDRNTRNEVGSRKLLERRAKALHELHLRAGAKRHGR